MKSTTASTLRSPKLLQPPHTHAHTHAHQHHNGSLQLPGLPRFHPANYPSQDNTPTASQPPMSPRQQQRQYSDAQRQPYLHQRDIVNFNRSRSSSRQQSPKPMSPRLAPLGSSGPVTPLELEEREGYFFGGVKAALDEVKKEQQQGAMEQGRMKEREREKQSKRREQAPRRTMSSMK